MNSNTWGDFPICISVVLINLFLQDLLSAVINFNEDPSEDCFNEDPSELLLCKKY